MQTRFIQNTRQSGDPAIDTQPCKLCGGSTNIINKPAVPVYYLCSNCDLIFMSAKYFLNNEGELERYKKHNNSLEDQGYVSFLTGFIKAAEIDKAKNIKRALDFGCGPEPVLKVLLNRLGINVDVYDPYFFPEIPFINKRYELITCTEVLEHLQNPLETLALLESLLAKNGILAIKTLFHTTCHDFNNWWYRSDPTHICFYSPKTFTWIEQNFNFKIKKMDHQSICVLAKQV